MTSATPQAQILDAVRDAAAARAALSAMCVDGRALPGEVALGAAEAAQERTRARVNALLVEQTGCTLDMLGEIA